ncbi:MAG TPA: methyltransferase domain-containing protein [Blastocatellia bacterium]|nr:methyltransferase domain-containing protein [Blastocatellia bacterium]
MLKPVQEFSQFASVDRAQDPDAFVRFLDTINQMEPVQEVKRRTIELLDVREGEHILDVGCGLGDVVQMIAKKVGQSGQVVGIDQSEIMLAEAKRRASDSGLPIEFKPGRAQQLEFPANSFNGCRADRVLLYVENPAAVLAEMTRVTKPGGRIVNFEPDWQTSVVDNPDRALTRRIFDFWCDSLPNGWLGRQLPRLHKELGLIDTSVQVLTLPLTTYKLFNDIFMVEGTIERAKNSGAITVNEAEDWLGALKEADKAGCFFFATSGFLVGSRKPN